jgi:hypothetical protein
MKNLVIAVLVLFSTHCFSQETITTDNVKDYMDKEVCVVGKVVSYKLAAEGKNTNYINIDKPFPDGIFTVVISNSYLEKLFIKIEDLKDKIIYVKGKITTFKNDPKQIPQIYNPISIIVKNYDSVVIKMKKDGNILKIPISINDVVNTDFIIDTGASNISISADLAILLIKSGTINGEDWLNDKYYQFADGSIAKSKTFNIKKLKIGNKYLYNLECSISNNLEAPLLLGQNVFNRFGKVTIDNERQIIYLD